MENIRNSVAVSIVLRLFLATRSRKVFNYGRSNSHFSLFSNNFGHEAERNPAGPFIKSISTNNFQSNRLLKNLSSKLCVSFNSIVPELWNRSFSNSVSSSSDASFSVDKAKKPPNSPFYTESRLN